MFNFKIRNNLEIKSPTSGSEEEEEEEVVVLVAGGSVQCTVLGARQLSEEIRYEAATE